MSAPAPFVVRWPSPLLSPDCQACSDLRAAVAAKARKAAFLGVRRAAPLVNPPPDGGAALEFVFIPPTLRRYNVARLLQRMQPAVEGIADYLGIDSARVTARARLSKAPAPGGQVLVLLELTSPEKP